jgi:hypothetical protein
MRVRILLLPRVRIQRLTNAVSHLHGTSVRMSGPHGAMLLKKTTSWSDRYIALPPSIPGTEWKSVPLMLHWVAHLQEEKVTSFRRRWQVVGCQACTGRQAPCLRLDASAVNCICRWESLDEQVNADWMLIVVARKTTRKITVHII